MNDPVTLIMLVLAVVIFIKLRSVLGRKTGSERSDMKIDPASGEPAAAQAQAQDNVIPLPTARENGSLRGNMSSEDELKERLQAIAEEGTPLYNGLLAVSKTDPEFDPDSFMSGARSAYEMIVMGFAEGNRKILKQLLGADVFESFVQSIKDRESRGETVDASFVGIDHAKITNAELKDNCARITIKFVSSLIMATMNSRGEVVDGDPKKVTRVTDVWTFARDVKSRNPNWKLVATQAG